MLVENVYRYPRRLAWPIEIVCTALMIWALVATARAVLLLLWQRWPLDPFIVDGVPRLNDLIVWMERTGPRQPTLQGLLEPLGWLLAALLITLILRNAFPSVRCSVRGMLVAFGNDWVPVRWEGVRAIRVTDTPDGKRFVLLIQTDGKQLTPYHRCYSFLYRLGFRRGFLITSAIRNADGLLREILHEVDRRKKLGEDLNVTIDERARSPLFSLFVYPSGLFGRSPVSRPVFQPVATAATLGSTAALTLPSMGSATAVAAPLPHAPQPAIQAEQPGSSDTIVGDYPGVLQALLNAATLSIAGLALWRYLIAWGTFLIFTFPALQDAPLFRAIEVQPLVSHWGLLIGAHLGLLLVGAALLMMRALFPGVTVDHGGMTLTALGRSHRLAWDEISFVKATDVRNDRHVILVEADGKRLPWYFLMGSWLYDGGFGRGALIWPMIRNFEPLMQRVALELTRRQRPDQPLKLRDDAPGWLLMLAARPALALDRLVQRYEQETDVPQGLDIRPTLHAASRMLWIAAGPALLLLIYWMMYKGIVVSAQVPLMLVLALIWGITEWPLASFMASSLDQVVGAGNKGYQGLYMYPTAQLPRLLPLGIAVLLTMMGFPTLALVAWAAGIAWSGLLVAGLWEALYGWRGLPLLGGSFMTIFFQILTLVGVIILRG